MAFKYQPRSAESLLARANQQGNDYESHIKGEFPTYKMKKGDNHVRILPPTWEPADHYGYEAYVHYNVGPDKASVVCNYKTFTTHCPICEARMKLEQKGDKDGAYQLRITKRVLTWALDMKDGGKSPVVWDMPWTLDRDIAKVCKDKRTGEIYMIDDPENGYDVFFDKEGEGLTTKYTGIQLSRTPSAVNPRFLDYIQENPIPQVLRLRTYEEVKALFTGDADEPIAPPKRPAPAPKPAIADENEEVPWEEERKHVTRNEPEIEEDRRSQINREVPVNKSSVEALKAKFAARKGNG